MLRRKPSLFPTAFCLFLVSEDRDQPFNFTKSGHNWKLHSFRDNFVRAGHFAPMNVESYLFSSILFSGADFGEGLTLGRTTLCDGDADLDLYPLTVWITLSDPLIS
ncbi:hypothetical protein [Paenirhodobacter sp.]|jgi:hypothetical protein|uniref:hypothetical protein n=1 Tax=Paenirhodobacter sp. TaxID=1965326 RepID=UPI003B514EF1